VLKLTRYGPFILGILTVILIVLSARASCSNKELIPYLGKWTGAFNVESTSTRHTSPLDRRRSSLFGYVMVYAMNRSFKMHLEGAQEMIDVEGKWTLHGHRLTLTASGVKIDDEGGAATRNPNLPFIPSADVRAAYAHPFVLDLSPDRRRLVGLSMSMGALIGLHAFARD
jgi:hypothetical protein